MSVSLGRLRWVIGPAAYVVALPFASVLRTSGPRLRRASGMAAALLILGALGVLTSSPGSLATLRHPPGKLRAGGADFVYTHTE